MSPRSIIGVAVALLILLIGSKSVYVVYEWERGVLLRFGQLVETGIEPGLHVKVPFMDEVKKFDVRVLTLDSATRRYLTVDKKPVEVDSFAAWRIVDVARFYTATSGEEQRAVSLLSARIDNGLRDQFGRRTQHEVVSGERDELMMELTSNLDKRTREEFGIQLLDIRVKAIELPTEVRSSVFARMQAERAKEAQDHRSKGNELAEGIKADADRQKTVIEAEAYRDSERLRGEGDAVASKVYADAFGKDPEFYSFYRSMNAYQDTFSNKGDLLVLDAKSEFLRYLKDPKPAR